jgi:hypothetical protein
MVKKFGSLFLSFSRFAVCLSLTFTTHLCCAVINPTFPAHLFFSSTMSSPPRLTKKQKKAVAFRERKTGKGNSREQDDDNDIPILEDQDMVDADVTQTEVQPMVVEKKKKKPETNETELSGKSKDKGKGKGKAESDGGEGLVGKAKKRKRDVDVDMDEALEKPEGGRKTTKRTKTMDNAEGYGTEKVKGKAKPQIKQRFILFVGKTLICIVSIMLTMGQVISNIQRLLRRSKVISRHAVSQGLILHMQLSSLLFLRSSPHNSPSDTQTVIVCKTSQQIERVCIPRIQPSKRSTTGP